MGWRVTAQNYNLNRDYVKADAPEMQAMLKLVNEWDPLAYIDLHVTDGAKFQPDVSIQVEPVHGGDPALLALNAAIEAARARPTSWKPCANATKAAIASPPGMPMPATRSTTSCPSPCATACA